jgi:tetratricopeptide (TPR) repeat protein
MLLGIQARDDDKSGMVPEAIKAARQAVRLTPSDHPHYPGRSTLLGTCLVAQAVLSGAETLDEAVRHYHKAMDAAHPDDPARSRYLMGYVATLLQLAELTTDRDLAEQAKQFSYAALRVAHSYDRALVQLGNLFRSAHALSRQLR